MFSPNILNFRVLLKMLWRLQQQLQQLRTVLPGQCLADPREALRTQARTVQQADGPGGVQGRTVDGGV